MKSFVGNNFGRYVLIGLQKGDLSLESLCEVINKYGIKNAIVTSGIAAVSHMRWHHVKDTADLPSDIIHEKDGPIEVGGITGMVINGVPHLHCSFANHDRCWAGHVEEGCRVLYVGELSLIELLDVDLDRIPNEFGISLLSEN